MVLRQSNTAKSLSGFQSNLILLSGFQDSSALSSLYLGFKIVHPYLVLIVLEPFQIYTYIKSYYLE